MSVDAYLDWSRARQQQPWPVTARKLADFSADLSAPLTHRAVRTLLTGDPTRPVFARRLGPVPPPTTTVPLGDPRWLEAAARCAQAGPAAVRGRRDAAVLVLFGHLGIPRQAVSSLTGAQLAWDHQGGWTVLGRRPGPHRTDGPCPGCLIAAWIAVLPAVNLASRALAAETTSRLPAAGACRVLPDVAPPQHQQVFVRIDRHGWVDNTSPLSVRSVTAIAAATLRAQLEPAAPITPARAHGDSGLSRVPTRDLLDLLDERAGDLLERTNRLIETTRDYSTPSVAPSC